MSRDDGKRRKPGDASWSERTRKLMMSNRKMSVELEEIRYANLVSTLPRATAETKVWKLEPEEEFRFEVDFKETVIVKLKAGKAELFGTELAPDQEYSFTGSKVAIFTWHGCVLEVRGKCIVEYTAGDTPMQSYLNVHIALENVRRDAAEKGIPGPKVMIVGPGDVGKSSLAKMLVNYAVRSDRKPMFVDIDINEGSLSMPGSMAAMTFSRVIDIEEGFGGIPLTMGASPLVYYYGFTTPSEKAKLYSRLVKNMGEVVLRKCDNDEDVRTTGIVMNTPFQFSEPNGKQMLFEAAEAFKIDVLLVIGHERLYSELSRHFRDNESISVLKLAKSGGVVTRDKTFRKLQQSSKIREYFYGHPKNSLNPYSNIISFNELAVRRVGDGSLAPSSALPIGMERKVLETRIAKVQSADILLNSILAVTNADRLDAEPTVGSAPALTADEETALLLDRSVMGFVYVSEVDESKNKLTLIAPNPGRLPKKYILMGSLKWMES
ncbi:Cleavage polyadenylation factor subunit clp1 [Chytridiales sp. JEL 0842]|nr:Cleavage polyadenylation factor subunit clp1 [Chytridiales sp. JEL 0842]